jgi:hypothetical protein
MPFSISLFVAVPFLFEETPGAEGLKAAAAASIPPQPQPQAAGIKASFSPLLGKDKQNPDFSWKPGKESVRSFVPRFLPKNYADTSSGQRPRAIKGGGAPDVVSGGQLGLCGAVGMHAARG